MDMLIQKAAPDDIRFCHRLTELENWNYSYEEIATLYSTPGSTFFIASDETPVGMVATFQCGQMAWLGLLMVCQESRGMGIGTMLVEKALYHVKLQGVTTVRLEAVRDAVSLYERLGFTPEFESLRMKGESEGTYEEYSNISFDMVEEISLFDTPHFGASRIHYLKRGFTLSTIKMMEKNPVITGYIMARHSASHKIGPCVAEDEGIFEHLLTDALSRLDGPVSIGIPACNATGVDVLKHHGFTITNASVRMVWGKREYGGNPEKIFAIGGPEKG
jgi:GNAT superfamily N-acetyltransferase